MTYLQYSSLVEYVVDTNHSVIYVIRFDVKGNDLLYQINILSGVNSTEDEWLKLVTSDSNLLKDLYLSKVT